MVSDVAKPAGEEKSEIERHILSLSGKKFYVIKNDFKTLSYIE